MRRHLPIFIAALAAVAQTRPAFDVATVKPSDPEARRVSIGTGPGGRFIVRNMTLRALVAAAYDLHEDRIFGSDALDTKRFDIEARPPIVNPPFEQTRLMLQSLLEDRFKLASHRETRELPVYFLGVEKSGAKTASTLKPTRAPQDTDDETGIRRDGRGKLTGLKSSIKLLADAISRELGQTVVDETALDGYYDFTLEWTPNGLAESPATDLTGPSLFTALHEQLGLKLEQRRAPAEVIVIDRIETTPTGN